jgi:hypothetical protein
MTVKRAGLLYGLITGLIIVVYAFFLLYIKKDPNPSTLGLVSSFLLIGGIAYALLEFRKYNHGYINLKEGMGVSFYVSLLAGLGLGYYYYYFLSFVDYSLLHQLQKDQLQVLEDKGFEGKELALIKEQIPYIVTPFFFSFINMIATLFQGLLLGTLMSVILRKLPESNSDERN